MRDFQNSLRFDYWLFIAMCLVCIFGIVGIFSVVYKNPGYLSTSLLVKQILAFIIGLLIIIFYLQLNYPTLKKYAWGFYLTSIALLVLVLVLGAKVRGARSWFMMGLFSFQPSELAKLAFIMFMAKYLEEAPSLDSWRGLTWPAFFLVLPVGLILLQPDFGSTLVFFPVLLAMIYVAGFKPSYVLSIASVVFLTSALLMVRIYSELKGSTPDNFLVNLATNLDYTLIFLGIVFTVVCAVYFFLKKMKYNVLFKNFLTGFSVAAFGILSSYLFEFFLKVYQKKRLVVFLDPYLDPLGSGYNIIQSKIAVGSGAWAGKGLLYGTQSRLGFLPEQHTDFIFSVLAEQFGFLGSALMLILLFIIVWRGIIIINQARDEFGALVATGIVTMLAFHIFLNIGMTLGAMPITGVPLPFVSYGGSSLVMNMFAIGILLNIRLKRFYY